VLVCVVVLLIGVTACLLDTFIGVGDGRNVLLRGDITPIDPTAPACLVEGVVIGVLPDDELVFVLVLAGVEYAVIAGTVPASMSGKAGKGEGDENGDGVSAAVVRAVRDPVAALWGVECKEAGCVVCGISDWNTPAMSVSSTFMSLNLQKHSKNAKICVNNRQTCHKLLQHVDCG
jgi:hypothetical protein